MRIREVKNWETPVSQFPDHVQGSAALETTVHNGTYPCYGLQGLQFYRAKRLRVRQLRIAGKVWMVDDPPHWWAMEDHATHFSGVVLCAGLGLGLIAHALARNPRVDDVVIVEQNQDVIELMEPTLPERCHVLQGDFHDLAREFAEEGTLLSDYYQLDGIFYDLFVGDGRELIFEAIHTFKFLLRCFPGIPIRIHGFENKSLEALARMGELDRPALEALARINK